MSARVDVDLDAFADNLRRIRETVAPAQHLLVVKDDAYGHGLTAIVRRAVREGVAWFGTFDVATAVAVREVAGEGARILAWTVYDDADIAAAAASRIELGVGDDELLERLIGGPRQDRAGAVPVHLKIDTGLHRNGIRPEDWSTVIERARAAEAEGAVRIEGVWSHIAEASDAEDDVARTQFQRAVAEFGDAHPLRHLAASAAAFARPEFRFDLVRIGAFAYGIRPPAGPSDADLGIHPIATLWAEVVAVDGEAVTVGIGSLDGLDSRLAGRLTVGTRGGSRRVTEIGATRTLVDAWEGARVGDEVAVLGGLAPSSATNVAEILDTIGEQVVLRISPRLARRYC